MNLAQMFCISAVTCFIVGQCQNNLSNFSGIEPTKRATIIMAYLLPWTGPWPTGSSMGPAILPALDNVRKKEFIPGFEIEMHWADTKCDKLSGMKKIIDLWLHHGVDVIIGDGCSIICSPVSLMASVWNVPMVS